MKNIEELKEKALIVKKAWQLCQVDTKTAESLVQEFVDYYNERSREIAKKYRKRSFDITPNRFLHI